MRRGLLTTASKVPISVGNAGTFGTVAMGSRLLVDMSDTATGSGTITTVKLQSNAAATDVLVVVGSLSGVNFTVRSVSAPLSVASGLNSGLSVALPIVAGDVIGYWSSNTSVGCYANAGTSLTVGWHTTTTAPTVGAVFTLTPTTPGRASILGTN